MFNALELQAWVSNYITAFLATITSQLILYFFHYNFEVEVTWNLFYMKHIEMSLLKYFSIFIKFTDICFQMSYW